jgi:hypothetical protein
MFELLLDVMERFLIQVALERIESEGRNGAT